MKDEKNKNLNALLLNKPEKYLNYHADIHKKDLGLLGRFFGSSTNAPTNIAGMLLILLFIGGILYSIFPSSGLLPQQLWNLLIPIITTIVGYLFGLSKK